MATRALESAAMFHGGHQPQLPPSVTPEEWTAEQTSRQNPRIRALLKCSAMLEEILDTNYAVLHFSAERLHWIQRRLDEVVGVVRSTVRPLLEGRSCIPALERAQCLALVALDRLESTALAGFGDEEEPATPPELPEFRRNLARAIGDLYGFVRETFSQVLSADPRSAKGPDYFLSRDFPRDIERSEALLAAARRLAESLAANDERRREALTRQVAAIRRSARLPEAAAWQQTEAFLECLLDDFAPQISELIALRGIRYSELVVLDRYSRDLPAMVRSARALHALGCDARRRIEDDRGFPEDAEALRAWTILIGQEAPSRHLADELAAIDRALLSIAAFVPVWTRGIEQRRALLGSKDPAAGPHSAGETA